MVNIRCHIHVLTESLYPREKPVIVEPENICRGHQKNGGVFFLGMSRDLPDKLVLIQDAGCHWEMEREEFLHPISSL
ncbi:hypothetical protein TNCV_1991601 [Trichonephila clavipes]|nr:hypothetical protein TNCV_1991601 [Trichonephila clavipes]